jgi:hypothetical protein
MTTTRHQMGRRQFLIASSTCALATAAIGPRVLADVTAASPKRLAIGFAPLDESSSVVAAAAIPAGDGAFIGRGARITVSGASGAPVQPRARRAVDLLAHYSYFDGAERKSVPFRAWSCSRTTGCQGSQVSFRVPVDEQQKLVFSVETERGKPSGIAATRREAMFGGGATESAVAPLTLSLTSEAGTLKLVRGYYVIVPLFDADRDPSWSSFQVGRHEGRMALVDRDGNVAPFEHFVLRIDYASES